MDTQTKFKKISDPLTHTKCLGCTNEFRGSTLLFHLQNTHCVEIYSKEELECLKKNLINLRKMKKMFDTEIYRKIQKKMEVSIKIDCNICHQSFYDINTHNFVVHQIVKRHNCNICNEIFRTFEEMMAHVNKIHNGNRFKCDICEKLFDLAVNLRKHCTYVHEGKRPFQCKQCGISIKKENDLRKHVLIVHEGHKNFKCKKCQKPFAYKDTLERHIIRNCDIKDSGIHIRCKLCSRMFKNEKSYLFRNV